MIVDERDIMDDTTTESMTSNDVVATTSSWMKVASGTEEESIVPSGGEVVEESSFVSNASSEDVKDEHTTGQDIGGEGKQKRKRTRYADHTRLLRVMRSNTCCAWVDTSSISAAAKRHANHAIVHKIKPFWKQNTRPIQSQTSQHAPRSYRRCL